jgi:hypothetical protein
MSWNYRVIEKIHKFGDYEEREFSIHEVYYKDISGGDDYDNIESYTKNPVYPTGETPEEFKDMLERYNGALAKPTLSIDILEEMFKD